MLPARPRKGKERKRKGKERKEKERKGKETDRAGAVAVCTSRDLVEPHVERFPIRIEIIHLHLRLENISR